ncbi:MAG: biopolymer transporter ExbD [Deltaproteobacteria bacterium]|nr:biopolymer transporter ExbD [Deltaproteobacteria bacterium]
MKVNFPRARKARIEMLPLIDMVFLLLVFFIYGMLSMAVHRGLPVMLPKSVSASVEKDLVLSITVRSDGNLFLDREEVALEELSSLLSRRSGESEEAGVMIFADKDLGYQKLFHVLDEIRKAGLSRVSLQAEADGRR